MLLNEIKQILPEVLNTRQTLTWSKVENKFLAFFDLDNREYTIIIEFFDLSELEIGQIKSCYEISFTGKNKDSNSESSFKATGNNVEKGHNLKVFSIVKNAVQEKLKTLKFDILFFVAKNIDDYYSSRVSLYQMMTSMLRKQLNLYSFDKEYSTFHLFVLSKQKIDNDLVDAVIDLI